LAKNSRISNKKPFRVGMIGVGGIAGAHLSALSKMDDVKIVAAADISEKSLAARKKEFDIGETFTDYEEMLEKVDLDAVDICTPNFLHAPTAIAALEAGCHAMVEKPMAMNREEAEAMCAASKKAGKKLCVGFQWRYHAKTRFLRQAIKAGQFGDVMYSRCQALRRRGIPNWGVFGRKDMQGGGPMIDIGVHVMEVAHYTMGSPKPVSAFGNTWTYLGDKKSKVESQWKGWDHKTYTVEDLAVGQIRFENGAILSIEASFAGHLRDAWNFQVMGTKGGADWGDTEVYRDDIGHMVDVKPAWLPNEGFPEMMYAKLRDFIEHAAMDKPSIISAEEGLMIQKMLDGVYASSESGGEVSIT